jgi:FtsH-binding integral membrane protein
MDMWNHGNTAMNRAQSAEMDEGLRSYMLNVYNYMAAGLALTGALAMFVSQSPAAMSLFYQIQMVGNEMALTGVKPLGYVAMFAPLAVVLFLGFKMQSMSFKAAQMAFWGFAALMGVSMANIFLVYTGTSIARVFFIAASLFGVMSLYGYTTKRDLTSMGSFLTMGVIGIIIASLVNMFLVQSTMMHYLISGVGVLLFVGLTAYDTQRIKSTYYALQHQPEFLGKAAIMGALSLYLDFINLFIMLLQFFGERR